MAESALLVQVRFPVQRYHGLPEWPPSPFRLYQALVAGALVGEPDTRADELAPLFEWLETLPPPRIAVPPTRRGAAVDIYMPNNDLDTVGGDPRKIAEIRGAQKHVQPRIFEADTPIRYLWRLPEGEGDRGEEILAVAEDLYQLGRGVDMAYAEGELSTLEEAEDRVTDGGLVLYRPQHEGGGEGHSLRSPAPGTFKSLRKRFAAQRVRLAGGHLTQAPPARFQSVIYNAEPTRLLFELVSTSGAGSGFHPIPLRRASWLTEQVRDRLAQLLRNAFGHDLVDRVIVGRGATEEDKAKRIIITPLPSIGSEHADHALRRVMITIPPNCPIPAQEIEWAAGAVHLGVSEEGEIVDEHQPQLVHTKETGMLGHFGVGPSNEPSRVWRSVTPVVLPMKRAKKKMSGNERAEQDRRMAGAVMASLRHAGVSTPVDSIRVQREPFEKKGLRSDSFEAPDRFGMRRRFHVEIEFSDPHAGPLLTGDGRFLGLGLFAPDLQTYRDAFIFKLPPEARYPAGHQRALLSAVRRALMALARDQGKGGWSIPRLFSGHEQDGSPSSPDGRHEHVFLAADDADGDGYFDRILVLAPWLCDRSTEPRTHERKFFQRVLEAFRWLSIPRLGRVQLARELAPLQDAGPLQQGKEWESVTAYWSTRHLKRGQEIGDIERDVLLECKRRGFPEPTVKILEYKQGPKGGRPLAMLRLRFATVISGPLLLGRGSHAGYGLFKPN